MFVVFISLILYPELGKKIEVRLFYLDRFKNKSSFVSGFSFNKSNWFYLWIIFKSLQTANLVQSSNILQNVVQAQPTQQATVPSVGTSTPVNAVTGTAIPQMLFLSQVTINGQTSFVLVDKNHMPVQLPQGKKTNGVINLTTWNWISGLFIPHGSSNHQNFLSVMIIFLCLAS